MGFALSTGMIGFILGWRGDGIPDVLAFVLSLFCWVGFFFYHYKKNQKLLRKVFQIADKEIKKLDKEGEAQAIKSEKEGAKYKLELETQRAEIIKEVDNNNNKVVDGLENGGFDLYLKDKEKDISSIKTEYIKEFVMLSNHLSDYRKNIQKIFDLIKKTENIDDLTNYLKILKHSVYSWQLLQANAICMIDFLINRKEIDFFRLYQSFEKLGTFDSTWQKNIQNELEELNINIETLLQKTEEIGNGIIDALGDLTFATEFAAIDGNK